MLLVIVFGLGTRSRFCHVVVVHSSQGRTYSADAACDLAWQIGNDATRRVQGMRCEGLLNHVCWCNWGLARVLIWYVLLTSIDWKRGQRTVGILRVFSLTRRALLGLLGRSGTRFWVLRLYNHVFWHNNKCLQGPTRCIFLVWIAARWCCSLQCWHCYLRLGIIN